MMNYYGWGSFWPLFGFGVLFKILFWIAVIWLFVKLIALLFNDKHELKDTDTEDADEKKHLEEGICGETALNILKKRYAKGEITLKEFEKMKKDIQ